MDTLPFELHLNIFLHLAASSPPDFTSVLALARTNHRLHDVYTANLKRLLLAHVFGTLTHAEILLTAVAACLPRGTYSWSSRDDNPASDAATEIMIRTGTWNTVAELLHDRAALLSPSRITLPQLKKIVETDRLMRAIVQTTAPRTTELQAPNLYNSRQTTPFSPAELYLELIHHNRCLKSRTAALTALDPLFEQDTGPVLHRGHLLSALMQHPDMFSILLELKGRLGLRVDKLRIAILIREWADVRALWEFFCGVQGARERVFRVLSAMPMRAVVGGDVRFMVGF